jgi:heptosyltransferase I
VDAYLSMGKLISDSLFEATWQGAFQHLEKQWAQSFRKQAFPLVALAPHPSQIERRWTQTGYVDLVRWLKEKNATVLILGGNDKAERELNAQMGKAMGEQVIDLTGKLSLCRWASILGEVDLLVAPDTGAVHIARALGTPVVGLYAVADPNLTGPYRAVEHCINEYPQALKKFLGAKETMDFHVRVHDSRAMTLINVDQVSTKIEMILANRYPKLFARI